MTDTNKLFFEGQCKREQSQARLGYAECSLASIFYQLIRVAIGNQVCLSKTPSKAEWAELYAMAKKQSLVGICFAGLQKLHNFDKQEPNINNPQPDSTHNQEPITKNLDEVQYLMWMGMAAKIQQRNEVLNERKPEVQRYFRDNGFACQVLKGQGLASLYKIKDDGLELRDLSALRQSGDIDVWLNCTREQLYDFSKKELGKVEGITYHHIHFPKWDGVEVEAHIYPSFLSSPKRNKALKEFCKIHKPKGNANVNIVPSLAFNRVYILLHCYRHFCGHGIGLRQLLDYYFVLKQGFTEIEKADAMLWIECLGMKRFAEATMWLMHEVFGMDEKYMLCIPDAEHGKFLLEEVMKGGNFGKYDAEGQKALGGSAIGRFWYNIKRDIRTLKICPHEAMWDPFFNAYQFVMRRFVWNK